MTDQELEIHMFEEDIYEFAVLVINGKNVISYAYGGFCTDHIVPNRRRPSNLTGLLKSINSHRER